MSRTFSHAGKAGASDAASVRAASIYSSSSADARSVNYIPPPSAYHPRPATRKANGPALKTVHTYTGASGKLLVQLHTPPQALPTYMGGSKSRGRGAVVGRVVLHCTDKDKASEVRIKLKAVVSVHVPKSSQATDGDMTTFSGLTPSSVSTSTREQVLLQLDHRLRAADAMFRVSDKSAAQANATGKLDRNGLYEWNFTFDIPEQGSGKSTLPVVFPGVGAHYPSSYVLESDINRGKAKEEWASVKWYIKMTVERPGLFRSNDRLLVPFIYLPPPPEKISSTLIRRQALSMQIQRVVRAAHGPVVLPPGLAEPAGKWHTEYFQLSQSSLGQPAKRSFVDKLFGANKPKDERWAISLPSAPLAVFPLRATIPFVLTLVHSAGMPLVVHPHVFLVQKVHLRARSNAAHTQYISHAKVLASPATKSGMQQWFGWVQFPSWCSPSFDTPLLSLEYFLQVKPLNTAMASVLTTIPVGLYCAPPRLAQARENAHAQGQLPAARPVPAPPASSRPPSVMSMPMAPVRRPVDAMSVHSVQTLPQSSPPSSRRTSIASAGRVAGRPMPPPMPMDPHAAGVAGIGRAHLPGADPSAAPPPHPALPDPGALHNPYDDSTPAPAPAPAPATPPRPTQPAAAPQPAEASMPQPAAYAESLAPPPDDAPHDAGPLTAEQEQAWTMDILANAYDDDGAGAFELPPSYFEATGIEDHDE